MTPGYGRSRAEILKVRIASFSLAQEYNPRFVEAVVNQGLVEMQRGNLRAAPISHETG